MTRTVALTKTATETESGSPSLPPAASADGAMRDTELAGVNGAGQATGKRQHQPIRFRMIYDQ